MKELDISPETHQDLCFLKNGLVKNPNKKASIMLLPKEILHELPIAKDWDDISRVASENQVIRQEISKEIGAEWARWASLDRKKYIKDYIFMNPDSCSRVIDGYRQQELSPYDLKNDLNYLVEVLLRDYKHTELIHRKITKPTSLAAAHAIIEIFKDWVENNRGWDLIREVPSKKREKAVQRMIHLAAKDYVERNNLDISCEPDDGRGPVDIKLSRGTDKTLAEIKLSTNPQYLHGYESQIREYGNAEKTRNLVYVFVDLDNPGRKKNIINLYKKTKHSQKQCPELIIIDARPKKAASTYEGETDITIIDETPEINIDDFPDVKFEDMDWEIESDLDSLEMDWGE